MNRTFTKVLALILILSLLCPAIAGAESAGILDAFDPLVRITVRGQGGLYGDIYAMLYPEYAPVTVENFLKLVDQKFYDGLTFHRIISGFMIQGGDPKANGTGGSPDKIKGEFSANGVDNPLSHVRGVLSMARSQDMDSASSQFFIMHADSTYLDGSYAAFGEVLAGQWVVDRICQETPVEDSNGAVTAAHQPVIESIRVVDMDEVDRAYRDEYMNGAGGMVFNDRVSPLSFPVVNGWNKVAEGPYHVTFLYGDQTLEQEPILQLARYNNWDPLPDATRAAMENARRTQDTLDTDAFGKSSLVSPTGLAEDLFTEEEHSGVKFYTAQAQMGASRVTYFVGANDGYVYLFVATVLPDDPLYADVLAMLDQMTFRDEF